MLILSRKKDESVIINFGPYLENFGIKIPKDMSTIIKLDIVHVGMNRTKIGFDADKRITVNRDNNESYISKVPN